MQNTDSSIDHQLHENDRFNENVSCFGQKHFPPCCLEAGFGPRTLWTRIKWSNPSAIHASNGTQLYTMMTIVCRWTTFSNCFYFQNSINKLLDRLRNFEVQQALDANNGQKHRKKISWDSVGHSIFRYVVCEADGFKHGCKLTEETANRRKKVFILLFCPFSYYFHPIKIMVILGKSVKNLTFINMGAFQWNIEQSFIDNNDMSLKRTFEE